MAENGAIGAALVIPSNLLIQIRQADRLIEKLAQRSEDTQKRMKTAFEQMAQGVNPLVEALQAAQQQIGNFGRATEGFGKNLGEGMKEGAKGVETTTKNVAALEKTIEGVTASANAASKSVASISSASVMVNVGLRPKSNPDAIKEQIVKATQEWGAEKGQTKRSIELATQIENLNRQYKEAAKGINAYAAEQEKAAAAEKKSAEDQTKNYDNLIKKIREYQSLKSQLTNDIATGKMLGASTSDAEKMGRELKTYLASLKNSLSSKDVLGSKFVTNMLTNGADATDLSKRAQAAIKSQRDINEAERQSQADMVKQRAQMLAQHEAYQKKRADAAEKAAIAEVKADEKAAAQIAANRNKLEEQLRTIRAKDASLNKIGYNNIYGGAQLKENIGQQIKQLQSILFDPKKLQNKATVTNAVGDINAIKAQADYIIKANEQMRKEAKARTKEEERQAKERERIQQQEINTYAVNVRRMLQAQNALRNQEKNLTTTQSDLTKRGLKEEAKAMQETIGKVQQLQALYARLSQNRNFLTNNKSVGNALARQLGVTDSVSQTMRKASASISSYDATKALAQSTEKDTLTVERNAKRIDNAIGAMQRKLTELNKSGVKNTDLGISNWVVGIGQAKERVEDFISSLKKLKYNADGTLNTSALKNSAAVSAALGSRADVNGQASAAMKESRVVRSGIIAEERERQKAAQQDAALAQQMADGRIKAAAERVAAEKQAAEQSQKNEKKNSDLLQKEIDKRVAMQQRLNEAIAKAPKSGAAQSTIDASKALDNYIKKLQSLKGSDALKSSTFRSDLNNASAAKVVADARYATRNQNSLNASDQRQQKADDAATERGIKNLDRVEKKIAEVKAKRDQLASSQTKASAYGVDFTQAIKSIDAYLAKLNQLKGNDAALKDKSSTSALLNNAKSVTQEANMALTTYQKAVQVRHQEGQNLINNEKAINSQLQQISNDRKRISEEIRKARPGVDTSKMQQDLQTLNNLEWQLRTALNDQKAVEKGFAQRTLYTNQASKIRSEAKQDLDALKEANKKYDEAVKQHLASREKQRETAKFNRTTFQGAMAYSTNTKSLLQEKQAIDALKAARERLNPATEAGRQKIAQLNAEIKRHAENIAKATEGANRLRQSHSNLLNISQQLGRQLALVFSVSQVEGFLKSIAQVRGEMELQQVSLRSILQNRTKADEIFNKTKALAVQSPFRVGQLVTYTKQLAAYRIESDKLFDTTKRLADVSAGLGVDMQRLILAYGQVKAAAYLRGTEVRQFTEAGVNMYGELQSYFKEVKGEAYTTAQIVDMISKRKVTFEDVAQVFERLTDAGGLFYNMQQIQSETLYGKMEKLKDQIYLMKDAMGQDNQGLITAFVDSTAFLVKHWEALAAIMKTVIGLMVLMKLQAAKLDVTFGAMFTKAAAFQVTSMRQFFTAFFANMKLSKVAVEGLGTSIGNVFKNLAGAVASHPYIAALMAIVGVGYSMYQSWSKAAEARREVTKQEMDALAGVTKLTMGYKSLTDSLSRVKKLQTTAKGENGEENPLYQKAATEYEKIKAEAEKQGFEVPVRFKKPENLAVMDEAVDYFQNRMTAAVQAAATYQRSVAEDNVWYKRPWEDDLEENFTDLDKDVADLTAWSSGAQDALNTVGVKYDELTDKAKETYQVLSKGPSDSTLAGQMVYLQELQKFLSEMRTLPTFSKQKDFFNDRIGHGGLGMEFDSGAVERSFNKAFSQASRYFDESLAPRISGLSKIDAKVIIDDFAARNKFNDLQTYILHEWAKQKFKISFEVDKDGLNAQTDWLRKYIQDTLDKKKFKVDITADGVEAKGLNDFFSDIKKEYNSIKGLQNWIPSKGAKENATFGLMKQQYKDFEAWWQQYRTAQGMIKDEDIVSQGDLNAFAKYAMNLVRQRAADNNIELDKKAKDKAAKQEIDIWQARISVLEKMQQRYEELRKKYGETEAGSMAVNAFRKAAHEAKISDSFLEGFIPDKKRVADKLDELLTSAPVKATAKQKADALAKAAKMHLEVDLDEFQKEIDKAKRVIDKAFDGYTLRTKLSDLGLQDFEITGLGGVFKDLPTTLSQVRSKIESELKVPVELRNMDDEKLQGLTEYKGVGNTTLQKYQEARKQLRDKEESERQSSLERLLKEYKNKLNDQLALDIKYYQDKKKIQEQFAESPELQKEMLDNLDKSQKKDNAEQAWKDFQNSDYYQKLFNGLDNAPVHIMKSMRDQLEGLKDSLKGMDPTNLKTVYDQIEKLDKSINSKDPLGAMVRGFQDYMKTLKGYADDGSIQETERRMLFWRQQSFDRAQTKRDEGMNLKLAKDEYDTAKNNAANYGAKQGDETFDYSEVEKARLDAIVESKKLAMDAQQQVYNAAVASYDQAEREVQVRQQLLEQNESAMDALMAGFEGCISVTEELTTNAEALGNAFGSDVGAAVGKIGRQITGFASAIKNVVKAADGIRKAFTNLSKPVDIGSNSVGKLKKNTSKVKSEATKMTKDVKKGGQEVSKTMQNTVKDTAETGTEVTKAGAKAGEAVVENTSQGMKATSTATATSLKTIESASAILAIIAAAIQLATMIASLFNDDEDKAKEIERLQSSVDQLQRSYEKLKEEMDKAWDTENLVKYKEAAVKNLEAQAKAYEEMARAEKSKKDSDSGAVQDYLNKAEDCRDKIKELSEDMTEALGGISVRNYKDAAQSFADAWVDAFNECESSIDALNDKMDEYFNNMIKKQIMLTLAKKHLEPVFKQIDAMVQQGLNRKGIEDLQENIDFALKNFDEDARAWMENLNLFPSGASSLSALQQGIQNITEEQAAALESLLNSMRFLLSSQSSDVHEILSEIRLQSGQVASENPMLVELQAQTEHMRAIRDVVEGAFVSAATQGGKGFKVYVANM